MAKAEQINALIRCYAEGDQMCSCALAMQAGSRRDHLWRGPWLREV